jgi:glutamate-1-semialdehyde 2,1-aminomutase
METVMNFENSQRLRAKSHRLIPGGAHTYAKGDDQYPEQAPGFIVRGQGCHVWDADGNEFIEYGMGLRSVTLGHAYQPVLEAAWRAMQSGQNFTRPAAIEVETAENFLQLINRAEMVKFAKNGSDVTTAAVKLARAHTGRDLIAVCADHPFFSVDDWFIGSTPMAAGIPQAVRDLTVKFRYNDLASVQALFDQHPGQIAGLVMEAETSTPPQAGFLHAVQKLCRKHGALFILDEIITGFRWHNGGAQHCHNLTPDLCTFGKALANGFALSALAGRRDVMELGGLQHDQERVFLLSTTFGAETYCLAAANETMRIYEQEPVVDHLHQQGEKLIQGLTQAALANGVQDHFQVLGRPCNLVYATRDPEKKPSQPFRTLFLQETIKRGLIMPSLVVSYSHSDADIQRTIDAIGEALSIYRRALEDGVERYLVGRSVKPVFRTYN